jgi:hypothetical protein
MAPLSKSNCLCQRNRMRLALLSRTCYVFMILT